MFKLHWRLDSRLLLAETAPIRPLTHGVVPLQRWFIRIARGIVALAMVLVVVLNFTSIFNGSSWDQPLLLDQMLNLQDWGWGRDGIIIGGVLLLLVAGALVRGKRQAWWLSLVVLALSVVSAVTEGAQWGEVIIPLALLVLTLVFAPLFATQSERLHLWRGYAALIAGITTIAGMGIVQSILASTHWAVLPQQSILITIRTFAALILSYGVISVLRPVLAARYHHRGEQQRAHAITRQFGHSSMAHFALGNDKEYFWSANSAAFIAYRVINGVALAVGDPIGPVAEQVALLQAFAAYCRRQDWPVALYQASNEFAQQCRDLGWYADTVGAEAVVTIDQFTVAGKTGAPIRHAIARAQRGGLVAECWHNQPLPPALFAGMQRVSTQWLSGQGASTQMGFSMGRFPTDWSPDLLTVVAVDDAGQPQAFLTWTPLYTDNGWSLDCMRRSPDVAPGAMELMIAAAITWAKEHGYAHMSLGLAPLVGLTTTTTETLACDNATPTPTRTIVERSALFFHRQGILLSNYSSLYHFKAKFQPQWQPRFLLTCERTSLPRIGLALATAHDSGWRQLVDDAWQGLRQRVKQRTAVKSS